MAVPTAGWLERLLETQYIITIPPVNSFAVDKKEPQNLSYFGLAPQLWIFPL